MTALRQLEQWDAPHAGVAVVGPDGVLDRHGATDVAMRIASVTKLLTAYAVLLAVEEEALGLDEPAGPPGATVRHLMAHTAGYGFESGTTVMAAPGTRRIYSNRGIEVLTAHLERVTGIPFATYLHEAVLAPLGMTSSELRGSAAFAVHSTVGDLALFARELLSPTLLAPSTFAEMVAVQFPGLGGVLPGHGRYDPLDWGLGVERNFGRPGHWAGSAVSPESFGHFGGSGTFLWADPTHHLAAVCLSGVEFGPWARTAWPRLCDAVIAERGG